MVYVVRIELSEETDYKEFEQSLYQHEEVIDVDLLEVFE